MAVSQDKRTPLHYAAITSEADCVLLLLQAGANPDQGDKACYGTDISINYEEIKDYVGKLLEKCLMCQVQSFL